jgi:hypothetical protein
MASYNCRMIEANGEKKVLPWITVMAVHPDEAARTYCTDEAVWDRNAWEEGDSAIVEVEEHGGENGIHRFEISAYHELSFSAEAVDASQPVNT